MGFCYDSQGRLVCDYCGTADGTTRRQKCPAGYCPATAMCEACRKDPVKKADFKAYHVTADCAGSAARAAAANAEVEALKATGAYVFCASVYVEFGKTVKCTFRNAAGKTKDLVVSNTVRDAMTRTSTYDAVEAAAAA